MSQGRLGKLWWRIGSEHALGPERCGVAFHELVKFMAEIGHLEICLVFRTKNGNTRQRRLILAQQKHLISRIVWILEKVMQLIRF